MEFKSFYYIFFCLVVFVTYYSFPKKHAWIVLFLSGIVFYMWSNPLYILVPISIISISYWAALKIEKCNSERTKKRIVSFAISGNVLILILFKYINFITNSLFTFFNIVNTKAFHSGKTYNNSLFINFVIPLGISYISFQAIGYLIEVYRGNEPAEKSLSYFSTYLLFFPKIFSGPVERAHHFLPQLKKERIFNYQQVTLGFKYILWGVFKKVVIADRIGILVDTVFSHLDTYDGFTLLLSCFL